MALLVLGGSALARARSLAQGAQALTLHLHTPAFVIHGAPDATAVVTLHRAGAILGLASGVLDATGWWTSGLRPGAGGPAADGRLVPGRALSVTLNGAPAWALELPTVTVRSDERRSMLIAQGAVQPPSARPAHFTFLTPQGGAFRISRAPDSDARASVPWPREWRPLPGFAAEVAWPLSAGLTVTTRWDAPWVTVPLGAALLSGTGPRGAQWKASVRRHGAERLFGGPAQTVGKLGRAARFTMPLQARIPGIEASLLQAGDLLSLSLDGAPLFEAEAPLIRARVLASQDSVAGLAPPQTRLQVRARTGALRATRQLTVPASGAFSASLGAAIDLLPDSEVWIELPEDNRPVVWRSRAEAERVTVTLGSAEIHGRAAPHSTVASSLKGADAVVTIGEGVADSGPSGAFTLTLREEGRPVRAEPGMRLLAVWELGGSLDATLPELLARFDPATEGVTGFAPPGARLRIRLAGPQREQRRDVIADADGQFFAPFPGAGAGLDWHGEAALLSSDLLTVVRRFARIDADFVMEQPHVRLSGSHGTRVDLQLRRGGILLGGAQTILTRSLPAPRVPLAEGPDCTTCLAQATLRDSEGFPVPVGTGDVIDLIVDGQLTSIQAPQLALEANPALDRVRGNGRPVESLALEIGREGRSTGPMLLTVDESGLFGLRPGRDWDWPIAAGDLLTLTARSGAVSFRLRTEVDGLRVDLEAGTVSGLAGPGERLSAGLYDAAGLRRAQGAVTADAEGRFSLQLREPLGGPRPPEAGDSLVVQAGTRVTTTEVPALELASDALGDRVSGHLSPPGILRLRADRPSGDRGRWVLTQTQEAADPWLFELGGRLDVAAGTRLRVEHLDSDGHRFVRALRLPQLHARVGDVIVQGQVGAEATVHVSVTRAGSLLATATRKATPEGAFEAEMARAALPWRLGAGDIVAVSWRGGRLAPRSGEMRMVVAPVDAALEPAAGLVVGKTAPGTRLAAQFSDGGLPSGLPSLSKVADEEGHYRLPLPDARDLLAGTRVEVGVHGPQGHRSYALDRLPYLDVRLERAVLTGRATPRRSLTLTLRAADSPGASIVATTRVTAGAQGSFVAAFADERGHDTPVIGGMVIGILESTARGSRVALPRLTVSIDAAGGRVLGTAPPQTEVELRLFYFGRPAHTLRPRADAEGRWQVALSSLPPSLPADELRRAELRLGTSGGHRVVTVADPSLPPPSATPPPGSAETPSPTPVGLTPVAPTPGGSASPTPTAGTVTPTGTPGTPRTTPEPRRIYLPRAEQPPAVVVEPSP